jgi:hypothetical protein
MNQYRNINYIQLCQVLSLGVTFITVSLQVWVVLMYFQGFRRRGRIGKGRLVLSYTSGYYCKDFHISYMPNANQAVFKQMFTRREGPMTYLSPD